MASGVNTFYSLSSPLGVGVVLFSDYYRTDPVPDGKYSDGTNCYTVDSTISPFIAGYVVAVQPCITPTPTPTVTPTKPDCAFISTFTEYVPPTQTPTNTPTNTTTPSNTPTKTVTPTNTKTPTPSVTSFPAVPTADFLVFTYTISQDGTSGQDLDTKTTILTPTIPNPAQAQIGFCSARLAGTPYGDTPGVYGSPYLFWGGDNLGVTGQEAIYLNVTRIKQDFPAATQIRFRAQANWYTAVNTGRIVLQLVAYQGGAMVSDGAFGFTNNGGNRLVTYDYDPRFITVFNDQCIQGCVGTITFTISSGVASFVPNCN